MRFLLGLSFVVITVAQYKYFHRPVITQRYVHLVEVRR